MDISPIVRVVATVVGVGAILGAGLAAAAQKFAVEVNPKISEVEETLPGINCGACGYPGCSSYAEAVATEEDVPANLCIPGGKSVAEKVGEITGKSVSGKEQKVSLLRCTQDSRRASPQKYRYHGVMDCAAVNAFHGGAYTCPFACVGLGNCARACPVNAITMVNGRPQIDPNICTGCGICVKICPRDVLILGKYPGRVQVYCRNTNPPKVKRKMCPSACIGCTLCMKNCPYDAIRMENKVAVVDHSICPPDCPRPCIDKCPTGAILARDEGAEERNRPLLEKHRDLLKDEYEPDLIKMKEEEEKITHSTRGPLPV